MERQVNGGLDCVQVVFGYDSMAGCVATLYQLGFYPPEVGHSIVRVPDRLSAYASVVIAHISHITEEFVMYVYSLARNVTAPNVLRVSFITLLCST